jgi:uncharacterized protein (DUF3084 family)
MKSLAEIHSAHAGKVSDKWALYLNEYQRILAPIRNTKIRLLEIGVQNGGSLEIWSKYFQLGEKFIGCDILKECGDLIFDDNRIQLIVGDINSPDTFSKILIQSKRFNVIIDDGSHHSGDIIKSFGLYFPLLKDEGLYIIEDLHCSYWKEYNGGLFDPFSSMSFLKRVADLLNYEHWGIEKKRSDVLSSMFSHYSITIDEEVLSHIHSLEFVNSMCVIRKKSPDKNVLSYRAVAGIQESILPNQTSLNKQPYIKAMFQQSDNEWSAMTIPPEAQYKTLIKELTYSIGEIEHIQKNCAQLNQLIGERDKQLLDAKQAIDERDERLIQAAHEIEQKISQNDHLSEVVTERQKFIANLESALAQREETLCHLDQSLAERDKQIGGLNTIAIRDGLMSELLGNMEILSSRISERDTQIGVLTEAISAKDGRLSELAGNLESLNASLGERDKQIGDLNEALSTRDAQIGELGGSLERLNKSVGERDKQIGVLTEAISVKDGLLKELAGKIEGLSESVGERDKQIGALNESVAMRDVQISGLKRHMADKENAISEKDHDMHHLRAYLDLVKSSLSWRVTAPLRAIEEKANSVIQTLKRYRIAGWIIWTHRNTGIFDREWYLLRYPDVRKSGMNPFWHFLMYGVYEGRAPHGLFTEENYKLLNSDISGSGALHYIIHGWREGRNIQVLFDKDFYLEKNKDVRRDGVDPVLHYCKYGSKEGRRPHRYIDQNFYIDSYKDIKECGIEPLSHYLHWGWKEGRRIISLFDTNYYLNHNHDIRESGMDPLTHYIISGGCEGRNPNAIFNAQKAWARVPAIKERDLNPLFYYIDGKWKNDPAPEQTLFLSMAENDV